MRLEAPDYYLPGELVNVSQDAVAIKKPNGMHLTVLFDGTDAEHLEILDQEEFVPTANNFVFIADRMRYADQMGGNPKCYAITILN